MYSKFGNIIINYASSTRLISHSKLIALIRLKVRVHSRSDLSVSPFPNEPVLLLHECLPGPHHEGHVAVLDVIVLLGQVVGLLDFITRRVGILPVIIVSVIHEAVIQAPTEDLEDVVLHLSVQSILMFSLIDAGVVGQLALIDSGNPPTIKIIDQPGISDEIATFT